ncbi:MULTISPECIES: cold-shock protein [Citricoccus]|uniref:Cold shock domain-containing protein n=1 Tax=Citricoccus muralis TaxID=169134 RepID=A0ABY8H7Z1_9MICC|nr:MULTISPECIES: cold shock domain-containing protein [Citricoccus]WBL19109.1 cold shock domain-containing protein [Citricoccus sp. NR2]WFP17269.1 cold shock domain-containing protein [Citricoccus muralis]
MPTGKVKFYDSKKGFGFLQSDDGQEVHLPSSALPSGVTELRAGTRMEFGIAEGRRGLQALSATVIDRGTSVVRNQRPKPQDMATIMDDLIRWLDTASTSLRKGSYPSRSQSEKLAQVLRKVADDLDA